MPKSVIIEVIKNNYGPINVPNKLVHRRPGGWNESTALSLQNINTTIKTLVLDDPSAALAETIREVKLTNDSNVTLLTSDPSMFNLDNGMPINIVKMRDSTDWETIKKTMNKFKDFQIIGNNAFSITSQIMNQIIENAPLKVKMITQSDVVCFAPGSSSTKKQGLTFEGLKNIGLKSVYYLGDKYFTQYSASGDSGKKAAEITIVIECEKGYTGLISVFNKDNVLLYTASRDVKFLPRTIEAYNISKMPIKVKKHYNGKATIWHNNGYNKTTEVDARKNCQDRMHNNDYRVIIPHQNNGTKGSGTWWDYESLGLHTKTAQTLNPGEWLEWNMYVMSFGNDKTKRDNMITLVTTDYFAKAYQSMGGTALRGPAFTYLISKFPLDRKWTNNKVKQYVRSNTTT